jgi:hypothetical protein
MEDAYSPPLAEPSERSKVSPRSRLKISTYWILVVAAMLMIVLVWAGQVSICGIGTSMSDAHAEDDSEGGSFVWFLLSKAAQFAFLGWHSMPFALCAAGQIVRRDEGLLKSRLHSTLFWIPVLSFAVALVLLLLG